jgi:pimeloyl-ACP methyl ester carboxylesterase
LVGLSKAGSEGVTVAPPPSGAPSAAGARTERFCDTGDVRLCYETVGDPSQPALLLIMGLGGQMITWHDDFCELLADSGFQVIRFDNRDCGRSTRLEQLAPPSLLELVTRRIRRPAYTLADMAGDAVGLLDHLDVDAAHVVGASMGGMIAQTLATTHPERVRTLTVMMSNTGSFWSGQADPRPLWHLRGGVPAERERFLERMSALLRSAASPAYPVDERDLREMLALSFDRGVSQDGFMRQFGAVLAGGNRTESLRRIAAPTLVIHGRADRLVAASGGRAVAAAIPQASMLEIGGMGHDLPRDLWPLIADAISGNAKLASRRGPEAGA